MRIVLLLVFVFTVNVGYAQKSKRKLTKADTVLHFFGSYQMKNGPLVITEPDSTIFPKGREKFPVVVNMFEAANKRALMIQSSAWLNNNKRVDLENPRAKIFFYFRTRQQLLAELQQLEDKNKGSIAYIPEFRFDKGFRNNIISMPKVK